MATTLLESHCVVSSDGCERNLVNVLARGLPLCKEQPERPDRLAIVAAGPSVPAFLDEIRTFEHIWAVNGAYNWLLDQGIIPTGFVGGDPLPGLAGYLTRASKKTTFYMSGLCDPSVFDILRDHDVRLWMPVQDTVPDAKGLPLIGGGTTVVTRAPFLGRFLGFADQTMYGVDSSFLITPDGKIHRYCYDHGTYPEDSVAPLNWPVIDGKGPFPTEMCLMKQVSVLGVMSTHQTWGVDFKIRCMGLMKAYLDAPLENDATEEVEKGYDEPVQSLPAC